MPRYKSRTGCVTCKRRSKKCDEAKPWCQTCIRLRLTCSYAIGSTTTGRRSMMNQKYDFKLKSPEAEPSLLPVAQFRPHEASVMARIPGAIVRFFVPTADETDREVKNLMQIIFTNLTVRDAVVACFSGILPSENQEQGHLNRVSLGSALQSVRSQICAPHSRFEDLSTLQIAIQFLGLLESIGPQECFEPVTHWIALSTLTGYLTRQYPSRKSPVPRNLRILVLEAIVYHFSSLLPFTKDAVSLSHAWEQNKIYPSLIAENPRDNGRLRSSPLLGGQYELWRLAFQVLYWNRSPAASRPTDQVILQCKQSIEREQADLNQFYAASQVATEQGRRSMVDTYDLHCVCLLIVLTALEDPTADRTQEIRKLTKSALQGFLQWKLIPRPYPTSMWSVHVLACAISEQTDWDKYIGKVSRLKSYMDKGHMRRFESVLNQVERAQSWCSQIDGRDDAVDAGLELPGSLFLLQQPEGLLHDWRVTDDFDDGAVDQGHGVSDLAIA